MIPFALAAVLAIPNAPSVDELVLMTDAGFCQEAERLDFDASPLEPRDLRTLWRRLAAIPSANCDDLGRALARAASRQEPEDALRGLALDLDQAADKAGRERLVNTLSETWVEREIDRLARSQPVTLKLRSRPHALPDRLHGAPPDLERTWRAYRSLADTAADDRKRYHPRTLFAADYETHLDVALLRFLQGREHHLLAPPPSAKWGSGWCGNGIERFLLQQHLGILMAALQDRSYAVALDAALYLEDLSTYPTAYDRDWSRRLLAHFGLDWEEIYTGITLDPGALSLFPHGILGRLVESGSERSVGLLTDMWALESQRTLEHARALAAFVTPGPWRWTGSWMISGSVFRYERLAAPVSLPDAVQRSILQALGGYLVPSATKSEWSAAMNVLHNLHRPESREALRRAEDLPDPQVQALAREALASIADD